MISLKATATTGLVLSTLIAAGVALAAPAGSATVLFAGGTSGTLGRLIPDDLFGTRASFLGGAYSGDEFSVVDYPASLWPITGLRDPAIGTSVDIGTAHLIAAVKSTPGPLVIAGVSQGAMVVQDAAAVLNEDPSVPSDTTFIIIGDPNLGVGKGLYGITLPILDYTPRPLPETRFSTLVIVNEYDGWADPIAHPWNLLTGLNALMALIYVHPYAHNSDLSTVPPRNVVTVTNGQGGTTSTYFVPTEQLPLTMPLRQLGLPAEFVDGVDDVLRPIIDAGYDRAPTAGPVATSGKRPSAVGAVSRRLREAPTAASRPPDGGTGKAPQIAKTTRRDGAAAPATASARTADSSSRPVAAGRSGRR